MASHWILPRSGITSIIFEAHLEAKGDVSTKIGHLFLGREKSRRNSGQLSLISVNSITGVFRTSIPISPSFILILSEFNVEINLEEPRKPISRLVSESVSDLGRGPFLSIARSSKFFPDEYRSLQSSGAMYPCDSPSTHSTPTGVLQPPPRYFRILRSSPTETSV